ncbi:hypothetical protein MKJ01_01505 [Chryseobacterium sp. SSA4.19]|uniref:hypothetical protein n=1 Tax=Chryseobacterium sp. SSA4.19 TaxID=2919915 RepID=UPI001F4D61A4|nr:hypothetical protein [Chryseobacterium sp. SSA4.19]MCJ8152435.1 hypothetical protein [Chryseobacterium sp. SSA4.19]
MNEFKITNYLLEWNINTNSGRIILELLGRPTQFVDPIDFENFIVLTKVLAKGNAWIRNGNIIFNKFS